MSDELRQVVDDLLAVGGEDEEVRLLLRLLERLKPADVGGNSWLSFSFLETALASENLDHFPSLIAHCCTDVVRLLVPRYLAVVHREWGEDTVDVRPPADIDAIITDPETGDELGRFRNIARVGFTPTERLRELVSSV